MLVSQSSAEASQELPPVFSLFAHSLTLEPEGALVRATCYNY